MEILLAQSLWPEPTDFFLCRKNIGCEYIFLHFLTPAILHFEEDVAVKPGGCVFFEPYSEQYFSSPDVELLHDWFHADEKLGKLLKKYGIESRKVYYPQDSDEITKLITEIELEHLKKNEYYHSAITAAVEKLLINLARTDNLSQSSYGIDEDRRNELGNARAKIHMEYAKNWTVEEMAKLVNLSPSRFYAVYKRVFGISPMHDLCNTRIQRARILLSYGGYSVEQVAELTGYNNQYHFIRQFKQFTGVTPGKYK